MRLPVTSLAYLVALLGASTHYALRDPIERPGGESVVAYVERIGPLWSILFGLAAVTIIAAVTCGKAFATAYGITAGVFAAYAAALWWTAIVSSASAGWVTGSLATALAIGAARVARLYAPGRSWTPH